MHEDHFNYETNRSSRVITGCASVRHAGHNRLLFLPNRVLDPTSQAVCSSGPVEVYRARGSSGSGLPGRQFVEQLLLVLLLCLILPSSEGNRALVGGGDAATEDGAQVGARRVLDAQPQTVFLIIQ
jgi:hypothetical protein